MGDRLIRRLLDSDDQVRQAAAYAAVGDAADTSALAHAMRHTRRQVTREAGPAVIGPVAWNVIPAAEALAAFDHLLPIMPWTTAAAGVEIEMIRGFLQERPAGALVIATVPISTRRWGAMWS